METLPRVEQPYTHYYPGLDVESTVDVDVIVVDTEENTPTADPPAASKPASSTAEPSPKPAETAQFGVSGYVGCRGTRNRFLPLRHANKVPPIQIDKRILDAGLGFTDGFLQSTVNTRDSPHMIRPDATMEIYRPFSHVLPEAKLDLTQKLTELVSVEYDMDEADLGILGVLATRFRVQMLPEMFELTMSMLDLAAALLCLKMYPLERRACKDANATNTTENRKCAVCNSADCTDSNTIIFCDGCDVAVHQDCYGVHSIPEGRWLCRKCESGHSEDVRCVLCPHSGGAYKQTTRGDWIHLVCALWTPVVRVPEDSSILEPVRNLELVDPERYKLNCYVCRQRHRGSCIQCAAKDCYAAFHPTCAQAAGFYMTNHNHDIGEILHNQDNLPVYCHRHSAAYAPKGFPPPSLEDGRKALVAEEEMLRKRHVSAFAKPRFPYWRTRTRALVLPHIVVGAVQQSLFNRLGVSLDTATIEFLCRYWTIKKDNNGGVMFNRRMYHALEVAELQLVRADQSEELDFTPSELLDVVDDLLNVLQPESEANAKTDTKADTQADTKANAKAVSRKPKTVGQTAGRATGQGAGHTAPKARGISRQATPRPRMTRKLARELERKNATVASLRKLRDRRSI